MNRWDWGETRPLGPRRGRWTQAELAHLRDWYGLRDVETLARELSRKPSSVRRQAALLFQTTPRKGPWTAGEVEELKRYLGLAPVELIASVLGREVGAVQDQIQALGRAQRTGPWSHEELQRLKKLYGRRSDEDLALIFQRPVESLRGAARTLHLAKDKAFLKRHRPSETVRMPRWSDAALDELRRRYATEPNLQIAKSLGKSIKSIVSKAHSLGLKKEPERLRAMGRENIRVRYAGSD
ncbi:MAG: hypothetical protein IPK67_13345 [Planctomycetes bacterium]|nr:hypothetical protein [Planctomycetota bacterium]